MTLFYPEDGYFYRIKLNPIEKFLLNPYKNMSMYDNVSFYSEGFVFIVSQKISEQIILFENVYRCD